MILHKLSN